MNELIIAFQYALLAVEVDSDSSYLVAWNTSSVVAANLDRRSRHREVLVSEYKAWMVEFVEAFDCTIVVEVEVDTSLRVVVVVVVLAVVEQVAVVEFVNLDELDSKAVEVLAVVDTFE